VTSTDTNAEQFSAVKIGIMADSHGDAARITAAAEYFQTCGCTLCIHLGDICDTTRPETAEDCIRRLVTHRILAIRGNNDHTLLLNRSALIRPATMATLRKMPLTRQIGSALLAHSLPFASILGPRCMSEAMGPAHIRRFFQEYPGRQLFRGHSHQPEIVRPGEASLHRERIRPDRPYPLKSGQSTVVTCGALAEGRCLVWDRQQETIELISLPDL
jgi:predicted phosphodiesterase